MSTRSLGTPTVADYLLDRLASLGVRHLFGVPGDYNLKLLDTVVEHPRIDWVGTANELGAAYAADGYARTCGFGALLTTLGVGELSAINGVAGSFAERVPLVHITVGPAQAVEHAGAVVHHTAGDGVYDRFARAHEPVTCAQAVLYPHNAAAEIDRVLAAALTHSRPVYIRLAADVASAPVTITAPSAPSAPAAAAAAPMPMPMPIVPEDVVDEANLAAFLYAARNRLASAEHVTVLADFLVDRFRARDGLTRFLTSSGFPYATLSSGKTVADEGTEQFLGVYSGKLSDARTRFAVDEADLLIRAGVLLVDTTTGAFSHGFDTESGIDLGPHCATVDGKRFEQVPLGIALAGLAELVADLGEVHASRPAAPTLAPKSAPAQQPQGNSPLTQDELWDVVAAAVRPTTTVLAEQGTAFYGICTRSLTSGARFIGQPLWASIGYTLPALLGAQLADTSRRGLLLIGDGSAQMTIQELGTIARLGLTPVIVLVNNDGYTIERAIHGPRAPYNDIASWDWAQMPATLGASDALVLQARTATQLQAALHRAEKATDQLVFIEAFTGRHDVPELLQRIAESVGTRNGGSRQ